MNISSISLLFFFAFCFSFLKGQTEEVRIPFKDNESNRRLSLNVNEANIKIVGTNRKDVLVKYEKVESQNQIDESFPDERSKGLTRFATGTTHVQMHAENNHAYIRSNHQGTLLSFEIEVPHQIDLFVDIDFGGDVHIENIKGHIHIEIASGNLEARHITGLVNASADEGDILILFDEIPEPRGMVWSTSVGDIDVSLPQTYGADLKLKTDQGEIYSNMDILFLGEEDETHEEKAEGTFSYASTSWIRASLNGGGPQIVIHTLSGSLYLRQKE